VRETDKTNDRQVIFKTKAERTDLVNVSEEANRKWAFSYRSIQITLQIAYQTNKNTKLNY